MTEQFGKGNNVTPKAGGRQKRVAVDRMKLLTHVADALGVCPPPPPSYDSWASEIQVNGQSMEQWQGNKFSAASAMDMRYPLTKTILFGEYDVGVDITMEIAFTVTNSAILFLYNYTYNTCDDPITIFRWTPQRVTARMTIRDRECKLSVVQVGKTSTQCVRSCEGVCVGVGLYMERGMEESHPHHVDTFV
jgi:hypothetical protein